MNTANTDQVGSVVFHKASEPERSEPLIEVEKANSTPSNDKAIEPPISEYYELNKVPYTAKYFEVTGIWNKPDIGMKDDLMFIDRAYKKQVTKGIIADTKDNFKSFISEAERVTDCEKAPVETRIRKIARYVSFINDIKKL